MNKKINSNLLSIILSVFCINFLTFIFILFYGFKYEFNSLFEILIGIWALLQIIRYQFLKISKNKFVTILITLIFTLMRLGLIIFIKENIILLLIYLILIIFLNYFYTRISESGKWYTTTIIVLFTECLYINFPLPIFLASLLISSIILFFNIKCQRKVVLLEVFTFFALTVFFILITGVSKYKMVSIFSTSMYDTIKKGDLVIYERIKGSEKDKIKVGDIIAFNHEEYTIIHRLIKINNNELITKGDNNTLEDDYYVTKDDVVGIYRFKIPMMGVPSVWIQELIS